MKAKSGLTAHRFSRGCCCCCTPNSISFSGQPRTSHNSIYSSAEQLTESCIDYVANQLSRFLFSSLKTKIKLEFQTEIEAWRISIVRVCVCARKRESERSNGNICKSHTYSNREANRIVVSIEFFETRIQTERKWNRVEREFGRRRNTKRSDRVSEQDASLMLAGFS